MSRGTLLLLLVAWAGYTWLMTSQRQAVASTMPYGVPEAAGGQAPAWRIPGTTYYGSTTGVPATSAALANCPVCTSSGAFWTCVCS